jgi:hypothetical protein
LESVFNSDQQQLQEYYNASSGLKRTLLKTIKMSSFTEKVFKRFSKETGQPYLLNKGEFYKLVSFCPVDEIPNEVNEKLDKLSLYLGYDDKNVI